ncbi:hypothetical protein [Nocardia salmonicida]|uniref:hypothetical protein n=1 Tax=Nocardia salmonicida TaxID=53431 RepID=UPI0007A47D78|nr:hypothetical protein [Nocardia salmonicida]
MDPAKAHKKRGRKTAAIVARKGLTVARKGVVITRAGAPALLEYLRMVRTVYWVAYIAGNDDAATTETVLTAIVRYLGEILACLTN